jgi:LPS export ABC transporter permease LptG/LPS export ABC transporter permease LptF
MRILDRYFVRESIGPFFLSLAVFTFVLAVQPMLNQAEQLLAKGVPLPTVGFLLLTLLPQALGITLPMAFLAGLLMAFGRLSGDRETVALLACGVNPLRLLRPVLLLAAIGGAATLYVMIDLIPDSNQKFREITTRYLMQTAESDIKPQTFYVGFPQKVLYVRDRRPEGGWDGVFLADTSHPGQVTVALAEHGRLVLDKQRLLVNIVLDTAVNYAPSSEPGVYTVTEAKQTSLQVDPKSVFGDGVLPGRGLAEMTIADLRKQWSEKIANHLSPHGEIIYIHQKFSFPVACFVFALLAVALGFHTRKEGKLGGLVLGLGVIFIYYSLMTFAEAGAKATTHWFNPHWARWFPNLVVGAIGIVALWWRSRATGQELAFRLPRFVTGLFVRETGEHPEGAIQGAGPVIVIRIPRLTFPRPRLLDLYVGRQYLRMFSLGFAGLLLLYYIGTVVDLSDKLFKGQATIWTLAQYMWFSTPQFVYQVIPIVTLVAVLGTIGGMTRSSELTVMRACGVSLYRAALPLIVVGLVSGGMLFLLEEHLLADANKKADELNDTIHDRPHHTVSATNQQWLVGRNGRIYYYNGFDTTRAEVHELSVFQTATHPYRLTRQTYTTIARCLDGECKDGHWQAAAGWDQEFVKADHIIRTPFTNKAVLLNPLKDFTLAQVDPSMMTFDELRDYIRRSRASGFAVTEQQVNLQNKLSFPIATLVMTALAVPFAVTTGRRGALYGIGLAIVLSVAYWLLMAFFLAAGKAGLLPAPLAAWATNVLFGAAAGYLVLTVRT